MPNVATYRSTGERTPGAVLVRTCLCLTIIVSGLVLRGFGFGLGLPALVVKLAIGGFLLALVETLFAKMRIFRVPEYLATAFLLGVLALLVHLLLGA